MAGSYTERSLRAGALLGGGWLVFALLLLLGAQSSSLTITWTTFALLLLSLGCGAGTFALFAWDKRRAQQNAWRVQEFSLHMATLLGGWSGAFLAQRWLRHKSQKVGFQVSAWIGFALHLLALFTWWSWR